jgi:hypothetical protein
MRLACERAKSLRRPAVLGACFVALNCVAFNCKPNCDRPIAFYTARRQRSFRHITRGPEDLLASGLAYGLSAHPEKRYYPRWFEVLEKLME